MYRFLYRPARWICDHFFTKDRSARRLALDNEILSLYGGRRGAPHEYLITKIAQMLLLLIVLLLFGAGVLIFSLTRERTVPDDQLKRNDYGMGESSLELSAEVEAASEAIILPVTYGARQYSPDRVEKLLADARDTLDRCMIGGSDSADHVDSDLQFPDTLCDGQVNVSYLTIPYGIISEAGRLVGEPQEDGSLVGIKATLSCQGETLIYERSVMVFPKKRSAREQLRKNLLEAVESADSEQAEAEYLRLPDQVGGRKIRWSFPPSQSWRIVLAWLLVLPPLLWFGKDERVHARARARREQLGMEYPDILWNMTMLLGAGMSVRQAFTRIATDLAEPSPGRHRRYAIEEMRYTLREMESGIGEARAYENFGRRCGLPGYIKLGSLLTTSVRKGTADLRQTLEKEAALALEERKNLALRKGERAATKMLFPMILMLGVVIVILIVPAFMSMT